MTRPDALHVAVQAQHLYDGACVALERAGAAWADGGYVGLSYDLAKYAVEIDAFVQQYEDDHPDLEYTGVFVYEVTYELGIWLAEHQRDSLCGYRPNWPEFHAELTRRITEFFAQ